MVKLFGGEELVGVVQCLENYRATIQPRCRVSQSRLRPSCFAVLVGDCLLVVFFCDTSRPNQANRGSECLLASLPGQ